MHRRIRLAGLILLVIIWGVVLLTPKLRLLLRGQVNGLRSQGLYDSLNHIDLTQLAASHQNDPRVQALNAEWLATKVDPSRTDFSERVNSNRKLEIQSYDRLIERFPREVWLIKNRLRLANTGGVVIDYGDLDNSQYTARPSNWLTDRELRQSIKMAERGARLEPRNSFYDWMRAIFLFGLKRNSEALQALHDGARKTHFDDGTLQDMNNRIAVIQMTKPLLWEDRLMIAFSELFPHLAIMRSAARGALWQGELAERRSDNARALNIYSDLLQLARNLRRDGQTDFLLNVGESVTRLTWQAWRRQGDLADPLDEIHANPTLDKMAAERFASYARNHGRPDIAYRVMEDLQEIKQPTPLFQFDKVLYSLSTGHDAREIFRWRWLSTLCLRALLWCVSTWLVLMGLHVSVQRRMRAQTEERRVLLSGLSALAAALFALLAFGTALTVVARALDLQAVTDWIMFGNPDARIYGTAGANRQAAAQYFDLWLPYIPLAATLFLGVVTAFWNVRKQPSTVGAPRSGWMISALAFLILFTFTNVFLLRQIQFVRQMNIDVWAVGSWLGLFAPVLVLITPIVYLAVRFCRAWLHALRQALQWLQCTQLITRTLAHLLVALSCAYLLTSIVSLPIRREANARLDDLLAHGEVALLREHMNQK